MITMASGRLRVKTDERDVCEVTAGRGAACSPPRKPESEAVIFREAGGRKPKALRRGACRNEGAGGESRRRRFACFRIRVFLPPSGASQKDAAAVPLVSCGFTQVGLEVHDVGGAEAPARHVSPLSESERPRQSASGGGFPHLLACAGLSSGSACERRVKTSPACARLDDGVAVGTKHPWPNSRAHFPAFAVNVKS